MKRIINLPTRLAAHPEMLTNRASRPGHTRDVDVSLMALLAVAAFLTTAASQGGIAVEPLLDALTAPGATHHVAPVEPAVSPVEATEPVFDAPAPFFWDRQQNRRVGARAYRFELNDPTRDPDMSAWYHLAYVADDDRLQVYEHNSLTTQGPESAIAKSQNVAWHVATSLLGLTSGVARAGEIPDWARPRTDNTNGSSGGLLYALADLDLLAPGPLAGELRVAATGTIFGDGVIAPVRHVDAKLAAARLAHPDVFFAPNIPPGTGAVTAVVSHQGRRTTDRTIGDWLNTASYEDAGRIAATHPGTLALVTIHDIRQALSWLCGRTQRPATCTLADNAAATPLPIARPYNPPPTTPSKQTPTNADQPTHTGRRPATLNDATERPST